MADAAPHRARSGRAARARATAAKGATKTATKSAKSAGKRGHAAGAESAGPADAGADDVASDDGLVRTEDGDPVPFETAMSRLEEVVDVLERGELELEQALTTFEEGVRLTRHCAQQLDAAERRIEILTDEGDAWVARSFGGEDPGEGDPGEALDESEDPLED